MVALREKRNLNQPPPHYKPANVYLSCILHHGGKIVENPFAKYVGGDRLILDYVVAKQISLASLMNCLNEWLLIDGEHRIFIFQDNTFKWLSSDDDVKEYCMSSIGIREVAFFIEDASRVSAGNCTGYMGRTEMDVGEGSTRNEENVWEGSDELDDSDYNMLEESDDEDDILFEQNVLHEFNDDDRAESNGESEEEPDVVVTDVLDDYKDSDSEVDEPSYPVFNQIVIFEPEFELGMKFSSRKQFQLAVQSHAIRTKRTLKMTKIAPTRTYVKCGNTDCKWKIHLTKLEDEDTFQISKYVRTHKCDTTFHVNNMKSPWLYKRYMGMFVSDRNRSVKSFRQDMIRELKVDVSKEQAYRARKLALERLEGDADMQYSKLWEYSEEVKRTNPGSTVIIGTGNEEHGEDGRFDRLYICLAAVKRGFNIGCRPIIGVDGCHLKGAYKGILLTAVGVDANNSIYPIAWVVVSRENTETWQWFLLKQDLGIEDDSKYTLMSDKQKGLVQAMADVFPNAENRFCVRHLNGNFKLAGFRGQSFNDALWRASQASTIGEWNNRMTELKGLSDAAWKWLDAKPPKQWSKSHFTEQSVCDMVLNNVCEVFNAAILDAREMPILTMLEWIRSWLMVRFQRNRDVSSPKWRGRICPKIKQILEKNASKVCDCYPIKGDNVHYEIRCYDGGQFLVDIDKRSCSCRMWGLSGIPCKHAICALNNQNLNREDFVHHCYTVETFKRTYSGTIKGVNGPQLWAESMYIPPLPPQMRNGKGKQANARRKEADEKFENLLKKKTKLKRKQTTVRCSVCRVEGHNAKTCGREKVMKTAPSGNVGASRSSALNASQVYDEEQHDETGIPTQQSQVHVPGPSMLQQLKGDKFKGQGPVICKRGSRRAK